MCGSPTEVFSAYEVQRLPGTYFIRGLSVGSLRYREIQPLKDAASNQPDRP